MTALNWTLMRGGYKAVGNGRTYYVASFHGDIHVSHSQPGTDTLTHVQWGGIADMDEAKAIAQTHNDSIQIGDQVTVTARGRARIAGLLRSIDGDTVNVATRFGTFTRNLSDMRPIDEGFSLNSEALAAIEKNN